jgi:hypothetical protein
MESSAVDSLDLLDGAARAIKCFFTMDKDLDDTGAIGRRRTSEQLAAVAELDRLLREHDVTYWLFGGWAVDFHAGRITREHADIDIAVWSDDRSAASRPPRYYHARALP